MLVKQVLLVETPECVAKIDADLARESQIVALSPQAEYALERRGLNFTIRGSYEEESQWTKKTTY